MRGDNNINFPDYTTLLESTHSASGLLMGLVEEVEISQIRLSYFLLHTNKDELKDDLTNSIKRNGLLQPVIVRAQDNMFEIVAGNRRYLACKKLGWKKIVCHIVELNDKEAFEIALTENLQRKNLDAIEEARAFKVYVDDYGWGGVSILASRIAKSPAYISKRLSLLNLSPDLLESIQRNDVNPSVAEEITHIKNSEKRRQIGALVRQNRLSLRETRQLVKTNNDSVYDFNEETNKNSYKDHIFDMEVEAQRSFDKSIIALKIAANKISTILVEIEDNWIIFEMIKQHKNILDKQIDILIKQKKKL
jgi:ParB family chromosome partitioning protein